MSDHDFPIPRAWTTPVAAPRRSFARSVVAQRRLHELVPGGSHTYARGSDQYPENMAPVIARGDGARVEDLDGNWYVEYGMGLRSVTLGHGYAPVVDAVTRAARDGVNFSRPTIWELRAAERFVELVPGAEMVKFAKNGSDVTTAAIKLARAATGRELVAVCGTQPFFSTDDWFIGTTQMTAGIPQAQRDLTVSFRYNDLDSVRALLDAHPGQIAALILEQATATAEPAPGFLEGLRQLADLHGFVLVFDSCRGRSVRLRSPSGPVDLGQGARQRFLGVGARRPPRPHGSGRPQHRRVPSLPPVHDPRRRDDRSRRLSRRCGRLRRA